MASTYTNDLRLELIATGEAAATWGDKTNTNLTNIAAAFGYATQDGFAANADATTTVADGAADPARAMYFKVTSSATLTATRTLTIAPNSISRVMWIENATTGGQSIAISQGTGANVTIATGKTAVVYLDGAGSGAAVVDAMAGVDPGVTDTLAEVLAAGNTTTTDQKIQFRDSAIYINSSADGQLDIVADNEVQIAATTIDINGAINASGEIIAASLDISGNIDVDGTTNLDVVDIDGAVDMASTLAVGGVVTANAGVVVDNITIDGNEIDVSSGNLTLDAADEIHLDADSGIIRIQDDAGDIGMFQMTNSDFIMRAMTSDKDIVFKGNDGGSVIEAMRIDMSAAGAATFNAGATFDGNVGIGSSTAFNAARLSVNGGVNGVHAVLSGQASRGLKISTASTTSNDDTVIYDAQLSSGVHAFKTGGTERMRIDSSGNVGIATNGYGTYLSGNRVISLGSGTTIRAPSSGAPYITIASNAYHDASSWKYVQTHPATTYEQYNGIHTWSYAASGTSGNSVSFSEAMRISDGNLLVGKTAADGGVVGFEARATGETFATAAGAAALYAKRNTNAGDVIVVQGSSGTIGSIGVSAFNGLQLGSASGTGFRFDTNDIMPMKSGSAIDATVNLGYPGVRFKDLHLSATARVGNDVILGNQETTGTGGTARIVATGGLVYFQGGLAATSGSAAPIVFGAYGGTGERARLTADGKFGLGTSSPALDFHCVGAVRVDSGDGIAVKKIRSNYFSDGQNLVLESGAAANIILTTSNVEVADRLLVNGATSNAQLSVKGDASLRAQNVQVAVDGHTAIGFFNTAGTDVGGIAIGTHGASISLGGNSASNTLDDYEEGTWTPTVASNASPGGYTSQVGYYTKVGRKVHVTAQIKISSMGNFAGATININGLPYTIANVTTYDPTGILVIKGAAVAKSDMFSRGVSNTNYARIEQGNGTTSSDMNCNADVFDTDTICYFDLTYFTS